MRKRWPFYDATGPVGLWRHEDGALAGWQEGERHDERGLMEIENSFYRRYHVGPIGQPIFKERESSLPLG